MPPGGRRRGLRGSYSNFHSPLNDWGKAPSRYKQEPDPGPWESESVPEYDIKSAPKIVPKSWEGEAVVRDKSQWYSSSYDVSYNPAQHGWIPQAGWEPVQAPFERNGKLGNSWTYRELKKTLTEARESAPRQAAPPPDSQEPSRNSQEALGEVVAHGPKVPEVNEMAAVQAQPDELPARQDVNAVQQPIREAVEAASEDAEPGNIMAVMKDRKITVVTPDKPVIDALVILPLVPLTEEATNTQIPSHSGGSLPEHTVALLQTFNDDALCASAARNTTLIKVGTAVDDDTRARSPFVDAPRPSTRNVPATSSPPSQTKMTPPSKPALYKQSKAPEELSSVEGPMKLEQPKSIFSSKNSNVLSTKSKSSINIPGFDPNKYGSPTARKPKLDDPRRDLGETSLTTSYLNNESSAAASSAMQDTLATESHNTEDVQPQNGIANESHKVEDTQPQNASQVNDHCAQDFGSPSQKCEPSINAPTSAPHPALNPNRERQNGVLSKAKAKTPQKIFEPQAAPVTPETKEETLQRLQQQQLIKVGYNIRHKGDRGRQSTVSIKDLELARRPLPANIVVEGVKGSRSTPEQRDLTPTSPQADPASVGIADSWSAEKKPNTEMTSMIKAAAPSQSSADGGRDSLRVPSQGFQHAATKSAKAKSPDHESKTQPTPSQPKTAEGHTVVAENRQFTGNLSKNKTLNSRWATPDEVRSPIWDTNSNAWGSEVLSNASVASEDSTKPMHHGKPFMNKPLADYDQSLVGWDGKMQPPPVDWNDRPNFNSNSSQFRNSLNRYLDEAGSLVISPDPDFQFEPLSAQMVQDLTLHPDGIDFVKRKSGVTINTARKYGYLMPFEHLIEEVVKDAPLRPLGDDDLMDWGKLDLSFGDNFKYKDETTNKLVDNWYAHKFGRRISTETQASKTTQDTTPSPEMDRTELNKSRVPEIHPHSPKANIYIRPAVRTDMDQLTRIYNWYVQASPRTTEIHVTTRDDMEGRFQDSTSSKLPWLVAVSRSHKRVREVKGGSEIIVGFALATDFTNVDQAERISAELELYVDKGSLKQGIGRCLLDKLLESTDRGYLPKGGYAFTCDPSDRYCYSAGGARDLHKLVFVIRHFKYPKDKPKALAQEENDVTNWIIPWLEKKFDFDQEGCFKGIGAKFGRYVNCTYMGYETKWAPKEGEIPENLPGAY